MKYLITLSFFLLNFAYGSSVIGKSLSGTGCNNTNSSMTTSPDGKVISVLFDNFSVEVPNAFPFIRGVNLGKTKTIKHCNISFSISVTENEYIESVEVINDIRGLVFLDEGIETTFKSEILKKPVNDQYGRSSRKEVITHKTWNGFTDEDIFMTEVSHLNFRQKCGRQEVLDFKFRNTLGIEMTREALDLGYTGYVAVDSIDNQSNVKFKVKVKRCPSRNIHYPRRGSNPQTRMDRVRMICERNGGRLRGTRCVF